MYECAWHTNAALSKLSSTCRMNSYRITRRICMQIVSTRDSHRCDSTTAVHIMRKYHICSIRNASSIYIPANTLLFTLCESCKKNKLNDVVIIWIQINLTQVNFISSRLEMYIACIIINIKFYKRKFKAKFKYEHQIKKKNNLIKCKKILYIKWIYYIKYFKSSLCTKICIKNSLNS